MISFVRKNPIFLFSNKNVKVCISTVALSTSSPSSNPTVFDILVHKHDFPREFASRVASELSRLKNPETADSMLSFLKSSGFSNAQLQRILRYNPRFLGYSLEDNIKPKIKAFQEEGFSSGDISKIISSNASILEISVKSNIIPSLSLLKGLLGSNNDVIKVVSSCPRLMTANLERNVVPNVEFLKSCGVAMDRVRIFLKVSHGACYQKPEVIRESAEKAKKMGINAASKAFIYAIPTIASMSNEAWEVKLQGFRDMGFSDSNILSMFRKSPSAFAGSSEKIKKIIEVLVATGKFDISTIADHPVVLTYSFEKRYKPRLRILGILQSRNLLENWPTLRMLSSSSDADFFERFVKPYLNEVGGDDMKPLSICFKL
ncbi:hypothetical protein C2S53_000837 [Perilla frutescens var. hirtella]|uniref:Uncharacterized protein n=1 Tax=Perilla frutescens var. hirtella TaxID=608512 RepID=A0AAD4IPJ8_PERFH|nr:hypothetical protein C2S53_000837 [Perilla frutescens var. hirtella]KAH6782392.1 hypothetical protein C2S51_007685 [Perilla frutescens var. frutescens]